MHELEQIVDAAARTVPAWTVTLFIFVLALIVAWVVHRFLFRYLADFVSDRDLFWRSLVSRTRRPMLILAVMLALMAASAIAPVTYGQAAAIRQALAVGTIVLIALMASVALHIWMTLYLRRFKLDSEDNLLARKHVTQTRILRRVADILITVVAVSAVLMTFESVRQYGVSLLASAGAAGIIMGLALQTVLRNLLAGIQLAITQPIRIDDVLIVEGEWGRVEEITSTYVVLKIWDWRRLVVPLSYFIETPFQNWTRESASLIGEVTISLDYRAPMEAIRVQAEAIVKASPLWDGKVFVVQVTDFAETTMKVRTLMSARDAARAFDLRCDFREKLVGYIQGEHPDALPVRRIDMSGEGEAGRRERPGRATGSAIAAGSA
jgi:small-conductance mechanosensitive channel